MRRYRKYFSATTATMAIAVVYFMKEKDFKDRINVISSKTLEKCLAISSSQPVIAKNGYEQCISKSSEALRRVKDELGLPGVVIGVSVNGETVWAEGFGMANVETQTPCHSKTKMRIASISKPITVSLLGKLKELGVVDLDRPVQTYVPYFPDKKFKGQAVILTARHLACHKGGIRHYKEMNGSDGDGGPEFYLKEKCASVENSLQMFKDDDLLFAPGDNFEYTTHGYTLLSAVIEGAGKVPFAKQLRDHLLALGMKNTHLDEISTLIYDRASYYGRKNSGKLLNAELTDNSYKWAGGGLVSNVEDLLLFANVMLYSYQQEGRGSRPGYMSSNTVREMWTPVPGTRTSWGKGGGYGLGWTTVPRLEALIGSDPRQRFHVGHSGCAVGASSVLVIFPLSPDTSQSNGTKEPSRATTDVNLPSGVAVAILTNLQDADLYKLSKEVANCFIEACELRTPKGVSPSKVVKHVTAQ